MKSLFLIGLLLAIAAVGRAQAPDPRDSVILESKTVMRGAYPGPAYDTAAYLYIRVWITNKDSLRGIDLALVQKSISGGAWVTLGQPQGIGGTYNRLTNTLGHTYECFGLCYFSDSFLISGYAYANIYPVEPPNLSRKPFWEIKFDTVLNGPGITELDTGHVSMFGFEWTRFVTGGGRYLPVNFIKSVINVMPKGDLNLDGVLDLNDVVEFINCVFLQGFQPPGVYSCDLNCDRRYSAADVVWELRAVFLSQPFPC